MWVLFKRNTVITNKTKQCYFANFNVKDCFTTPKSVYIGGGSFSKATTLFKGHTVHNLHQE